MAEVHNSGILLESGTNEIEIMEFTIDNNLYGINVAKVREIIMPTKVKPMPHAHPAVEGIIKPRDIVITVVDLPTYLGAESQKRDVHRLPGAYGGRDQPHLLDGYPQAGQDGVRRL